MGYWEEEAARQKGYEQAQRESRNRNLGGISGKAQCLGCLIVLLAIVVGIIIYAAVTQPI